MPFSITINLGGNCREAVTFYAKVFQQDIPLFLTYGEGVASFDSDFDVPEKMKSRVMTASLNIAGTVVEFCDTPDIFGFVQGNGMFLTITFENSDEAKVIFDRLSDNGYVDASFSKTKDGRYYGKVEDKFNMGWIIKA